MNYEPSSPDECFAAISEQVLEDFGDFQHQLRHVGSSVLEGLRNDDIDAAIYFPSTASNSVLSRLQETGWRPGPFYPGDDWQSFRKGKFNLLVCWSEQGYKCWAAYGFALESLAAVNPYPFFDKELRIALCAAVFQIVEES